MVIDLRPAVPADAAFLAEMLVVAAFWRPGGPSGGVRDVLARPELAKYIAGWPQPGDRGVVAEVERPVGAAWLRFLPTNDPGYGFVDARTPEVSIGVVQQWRGRGVGTQLLDALIAQARDAGLTTFSLSVEQDNEARRLYERCGFRTVGEVGGALTMLLEHGAHCLR